MKIIQMTPITENIAKLAESPVLLLTILFVRQRKCYALSIVLVKINILQLLCETTKRVWRCSSKYFQINIPILLHLLYYSDQFTKAKSLLMARLTPTSTSPAASSIQSEWPATARILTSRWRLTAPTLLKVTSSQIQRNWTLTSRPFDLKDTSENRLFPNHQLEFDPNRLKVSSITKQHNQFN